MEQIVYLSSNKYPINYKFLLSTIIYYDLLEWDL